MILWRRQRRSTEGFPENITFITRAVLLWNFAKAHFVYTIAELCKIQILLSVAK